MGGAVLALHCARPGAAWALLLPVLLLLLLRTAPRPLQVVVGTLELWRGIHAPAGGGRARPRAEPWARLCALGLLLGALAWLGPRGASAAAARTWTCVVDRSPSMGLAAGGTRTGTRLDAALAAAEAWLAEVSEPTDRVCWLAPGRAALELARGKRPAPAWLAPDEKDGGEPAWARHDQPGALWLTDRAPAGARAHAGLFASGGAAVFGAVAADGRSTWLWEGGELRAVANTRAPAVRVQAASGLALPAVLERVLLAWCAARGFELVTAGDAEALLVLELVPSSGRDEELVLERDGWRASALGALAELQNAEEPASEDWLRGRTIAGATVPVVRVGPGRIQLALREFSEPAGDPALFALSWARLCDGAALLPAGVVPLAERQAAGAPVLAPGEFPAVPGGAGAELGPLFDALLALGALACALWAYLLVLRARSG